jgi:hypothetical protein
MSLERLGEAEIWLPDGHVSDVALTALADGEDALLPEAARSHVEGCDSCTERLGEQALMSLSLSRALGSSENAPAYAPTSLPLPLGAVLAALVVAVLGALPRFLGGARDLPALPSAIADGVVVALRAGAALLRVAGSGNPAVAVVWLGAAVVLAAFGLLVARFAPREMAWKGARK